jgi:hypothetical protein
VSQPKLYGFIKKQEGRDLISRETKSESRQLLLLIKQIPPFFKTNVCFDKTYTRLTSTLSIL